MNGHLQTVMSTSLHLLVIIHNTVYCQMFEEVLRSDISSEISDCTQGKPVQLVLHQALLANCCEFWKSILSGNFCEANRRPVMVEVAATATGLVLQLNWLQPAKYVMEREDKFKLPVLISACVQHLNRSLNPESACTILNARTQLNLAPPQDTCSDFMAKHGKAVQECFGLKKLAKDAAVSIISNQSLDAAKQDVFNALLARGQGLVHSGEAATISDAGGVLLCHLRFDEMDWAFSNNTVSRPGLLSGLVVLSVAQNTQDRQNWYAKQVFKSEDGDEARCCPFDKKRSIWSVQ
jgi:hypothetical protein